MNAKDYIETMDNDDLPPVPPERSESTRRRISSSDAIEQPSVNTQATWCHIYIFMK